MGGMTVSQLIALLTEMDSDAIVHMQVADEGGVFQDWVHNVDDHGSDVWLS